MDNVIPIRPGIEVPDNSPQKEAVFVLGLPGAGKTTFLKTKTAPIISFDKIRKDIYGVPFDAEGEGLVLSDAQFYLGLFRNNGKVRFDIVEGQFMPDGLLLDGDDWSAALGSEFLFKFDHTTDLVFIDESFTSTFPLRILLAQCERLNIKTSAILIDRNPCDCRETRIESGFDEEELRFKFDEWEANGDLILEMFEDVRIISDWELKDEHFLL